MTIESIYRVRPMYLRGFTITYATSTTLSISSGMCSDSTGSVDINVGTFTGTSGSATTLSFAAGYMGGVNGLDTGAITANKLYYIYAISDVTGRSPSGFLASLSTTPLLPAGIGGGNYSHYRRIGYAITNNGAATLQILWQSGKESSRWYQYDTMPGASLTAGTSATFVEVPLITASGSYVVVPPVAGRVQLLCTNDPNAAGDIFGIRPYGSSSTAGTSYAMSGAAAGSLLVTAQTGINATPNQSVYYLVTASGSLTMTVYAFEDLL